MKYFKENGIKKIEVDSINDYSADFYNKLCLLVDDEPKVKSSINFKLSV